MTGAATGRSFGAADGEFRTMDTRDITVSIVGTNNTTVVDGTGQFTLTNVSPGVVTLDFTGPGSSGARVTISGIGQNDQIQIVVSLSGNSARLESEHHSSPGNQGEFVGRIASINTGTRSFVVSGVTVKVPDGVTIRHGQRIVPFTDLKVGDQVQVRGPRDGSTITATEVKVEADNDDNDDDQGEDDDNDDHRGGDANSVELSGTITTFGGTCPVVNFVVKTTKVVTSAATTYDHTTCASLKNSLKVEVRGTKAADGTMTATRVSLDD